MMKKLIWLGSFLILAACGFQPVHQAELKGGQSAYPNITIRNLDGKTPDDQRVSFEIRQALLDRINTHSNRGEYILEFNPILRQIRIGITGEAIASRFDLRLTTHYSIIEGKTGDILYNDSIKSRTSFAAPLDPYSRIQTENSAIDRLAKDAADDLILALSKFYANPPKRDE